MGTSLLYRMTWLDKLELEGRCRGGRKILLALLEGGFGPVPDNVRERIEKIRSMDRLIRLARKTVDAKSLKSLRLG